MVRDMAGGRKKAVVYQRGICRTWAGTSLDGGRLGGAVHSTQLRKGKAKGFVELKRTLLEGTKKGTQFNSTWQLS